MARGRLERVIENGFVLRSLRGFYRRRLTERGRFLFWTAAALALLGADTRRALVFVLFCCAAPPLLVALPQLLRRAPAVRITARIPSRLTAGRELETVVEVGAQDGAAMGTLSLAWDAPLPDSLTAEPSARLLEVAPGPATRTAIRLRAARRGRFELPALLVAHTDAFGLLRSKSRWLSPRTLLAYPRYFALEALDVPLGRRYQPGGIPLASEVGESLEFVGAREYREGDPPRKIHWRSWARLGRPVVKEYQEEYFSRVALVLDTFLPRRARPAELRRFEAAVSTLASVAEAFSRTDDVVDVLAAGPDLYEVSAGRSLGSLDTVLEVLACLEPCDAAPFAAISPPLSERLERLTAVVAVMLDWDAPREDFLQRVLAAGVAVHVLLVHEGDTRAPWQRAADAIGSLTLLPPQAVEARLDAAGGR